MLPQWQGCERHGFEVSIGHSIKTHLAIRGEVLVTTGWVQGERTQPPHCPSSCVVISQTFSQTIICQLRTKIYGTNFSRGGLGESTPYPYTHILLVPFEFCGRIFGQRPTIRKSPIPLPATPSSSVYILDGPWTFLDQYFLDLPSLLLAAWAHTMKAFMGRFTCTLFFSILENMKQEN